MATQRRSLPDHARDPVTHSRDIALTVQVEAQRLLEEVERSMTEGRDSYATLAAATARVGLIGRMAAAIVRHLEQIEGVDAPPDLQVIHLAERRR